MKTNEIKKLIESFYDGQTSPSEELLLFNYFNQEEISDELLEEKTIFLKLYSPNSINIPTNLESNLDALIDTLAEKETKSKTPNKSLVFWYSIAAGIAIAISAGVYINNSAIQENGSMLANKQQTPEAIQAEVIQAEEAMRLLSYNFNKGMQQLDEMQTSIENTNRILNETFNKH